MSDVSEIRKEVEELKALVNNWSGSWDEIIFGSRGRDKFKYGILDVLDTRFADTSTLLGLAGANNLVIWQNQWPAYKLAVEQVINENNPFYVWERFSELEPNEEKRGGKYLRALKDSIIEQIKNKGQSSDPIVLDVWRKNLIKGLIERQSGKLDLYGEGSEYTLEDLRLNSGSPDYYSPELQWAYFTSNAFDIYGYRNDDEEARLWFPTEELIEMKEWLGQILRAVIETEGVDIDDVFDIDLLGTVQIELYTLEKAYKEVSEAIRNKIKDSEDIELQLSDDQIEWFPRFQSATMGDFYLQAPGVSPDEGEGKFPFIRFSLIGEEKWDDPLIADIYNHDPVQYPGVEGSVFQSDSYKDLIKTFGDTGFSIATYDFNYTPSVPQSGLEEGVWDWFWSAEYDALDQVKLLFKNQHFSFLLETITDANSRISDDTQANFAEETFNKWFDDNFISDLYGRLLLDKEIERRVEKFKKLAEELKDVPDDGPLTEDQTAELAEKANNAGNEAMLRGSDPTPVGDTKLSEEDIKKREKFFKQCALILNMDSLKEGLSQQIKRKGKRHKKKPFGGRFWMAECAVEQELLINNLVSPEDGKEFFEIPPPVVSNLVPKIRLFRVENNKKKLQETEFIFPQSTDIDRTRDYSSNQPQDLAIPSSFLEAPFDKGDGCGLKEFSFEFNGTNPAESRNDITANLTLYFQTFTDFVRERVSYNGQKYRFVDLIIQPAPDKDGKVNGVSVIHPNQYDPSFYRIRAEVGYHYPDNMDDLYNDPDKKLKSAIQRTNRSFFLCMVDHDINIDVDGSVTISISYRAYVETALKSLRFDSLSTPELISAKRNNLRLIEELLDSKSCTIDEIKEIKLTAAAKEEELRKKSLQSIVQRLYDDHKIFIVKVDPDHARQFRENGSFTSCTLTNIKGERIIPFTPSDALDSIDAGSLIDNILSSEPPDDWNYNNEIDNNIQYFFFGDLLYTIMDTMFEQDGKFVEGLENTRIILGSFDYHPYIKESQGNTINIAQIPISLDFFTKWFTDNVIAQGETRKSFPILTFIRNLSNNLLQTSLLETCVNRDVEKSLRFSTGQISAYSKNGKDPLNPLVSNEIPIINTDSHRGPTGVLPLSGDSDNELRSKNKITNYYNYLVLNVLGSSLSYTGRGDYAEDVKVGRYHVDIGSNKGIVKTVSFSKTDMQYIREARLFQQGIDGLQQLTNVYKVSVEMYGNTLFYPGMEMFINPYGIGGTALGSPTRGPKSSSGRSMANTLGLGGYHTIISIKSSLTPGNYSTTIEAQQYYSGDGQGNPNPDGVALRKEKAKRAQRLEQESAIPDATNRTDIQQDFCRSILQSVLDGDQGTTTVQSIEEFTAAEEALEQAAEYRFENTTTEAVAGEVYELAFQPTDDEGKDDGTPKIWQYDSVRRRDQDNGGYSIFYDRRGDQVASVTKGTDGEGNEKWVLRIKDVGIPYTSTVAPIFESEEALQARFDTLSEESE